MRLVSVLRNADFGEQRHPQLGNAGHQERKSVVWGEDEPKNGRYLTPARAINHTDEELGSWPAWSCDFSARP